MDKGKNQETQEPRKQGLDLHGMIANRTVGSVFYVSQKYSVQSK